MARKFANPGFGGYGQEEMIEDLGRAFFQYQGGRGLRQQAERKARLANKLTRQQLESSDLSSRIKEAQFNEVMRQQSEAARMRGLMGEASQDIVKAFSDPSGRPDGGVYQYEVPTTSFGQPMTMAPQLDPGPGFDAYTGGTLPGNQLMATDLSGAQQDVLADPVYRDYLFEEQFLGDQYQVPWYAKFPDDRKDITRTQGVPVPSDIIPAIDLPETPETGVGETRTMTAPVDLAREAANMRNEYLSRGVAQGYDPNALLAQYDKTFDAIAGTSLSPEVRGMTTSAKTARIKAQAEQAQFAYEAAVDHAYALELQGEKEKSQLARELTKMQYEREGRFIPKDAREAFNEMFTDEILGEYNIDDPKDALVARSLGSQWIQNGMTVEAAVNKLDNIGTKVNSGIPFRDQFIKFNSQEAILENAERWPEGRIINDDADGNEYMVMKSGINGAEFKGQKIPPNTRYLMKLEQKNLIPENAKKIMDEANRAQADANRNNIPKDAPGAKQIAKFQAAADNIKTAEPQLDNPDKGFMDALEDLLPGTGGDMPSVAGYKREQETKEYQKTKNERLADTLEKTRTAINEIDKLPEADRGVAKVQVIQNANESLERLDLDFTEIRSILNDLFPGDFMPMDTGADEEQLTYFMP